VTTLPLRLVSLTSGFAALTPTARAAGRRALMAAEAALSAALGQPLRLEARPLPAAWAPGVGVARLEVALGAVAAQAVIEVDARLAARAVDLLAGGQGDVPGALAVTPIESAALELLVLLALDGVCTVAEIDALAPRLVRREEGGAAGALVVELELGSGAVRGAARLAVPPAALSALGAPASEAPQGGCWHLDASLRRGTATLGEADLAALAPGDLVLLDATPGRDELVLPGGLALRGSRQDDLFTVEDAAMQEWAGEFPIALSVEIARVTVTVGELARLEPGGVIRLQVGREGAVTLRAGERAVARGQLVEVDGALAVRVDAIEGRP
jgi:flagellar motor switch/type III secretory pathway protein FliN